MSISVIKQEVEQLPSMAADGVAELHGKIVESLEERPGKWWAGVGNGPIVMQRLGRV